MVDLQWVLTASIQMVDQNYTNLSAVCPHIMTDDQHSGWVFTVFGECVTNLRQWFAFWIGMSSIIFWLFAQVPQLITNCRTGQADKALSFWFLLQWFLGDATNLIGALLAHQLPTQIATAVYFVIIDTVTMLQFLYYVIKNQGFKGFLNCCGIKRKPPVLAALLPGVMFTVFLASQSRLLWSDDPYQTGHRMGRTLKDIDMDLSDPEDIAGYVLGCISAIFYVMSRVPQIVKNCRRCSVEGLSPIMFVLAILGNVTYGLGIFLYSVDPVFLLQKLPWLVGSVGTLFFDFTIVIQFLVSLCSKQGHRLCRNVEDGSDKEPLLNQAASDSDSFTKSNGSIQASKHVSKRSRSQSPNGLQNGYKSVQ